MKHIYHAFALLSLALFVGSCDLQETFDERIDDKQLLVLTPDFADTSVQLVFRDPETLAVIDKDFEVTVYANKRLVDLNGNYKNQFIARGGVMEFFVSPEETVSEGDPLELIIKAISVDQTKFLFHQEATITEEGFLSIPLRPEGFPQFISENTILNANQKSRVKHIERNHDNEEIAFDLLFNNSPVTKISSYCNEGLCIMTDDEEIEFGYTRKYYFTNLTSLTQDLEIRIDGPLNLASYEVTGEYSYYDFIAPRNVFFKFNETGILEQSIYDTSDPSNHRLIGRESNQLASKGVIYLKKGMVLYDIDLKTYINEEFRNCRLGFNLDFQGLEPGEEVNIYAKGSYTSDQKIFYLSSFNLNSKTTKFNSLRNLGSNSRHYLSINGNQLEFAENSQYIIEPQIIDLGGAEACDNTYTVRLKRRDTHKKHQLNLSMRNENQNVGLALTFSALIRKQGQDNSAWETVNFKQGSTSVYLEEGSNYEVKLTLGDEPFEFTFTNDLSLIEAAVQATLKNTTRIKDINYTIDQTADLNTIDAMIVFYEGESLFD